MFFMAIEEVKFDLDIGKGEGGHDDERRLIREVFNDYGNGFHFVARQMKIFEPHRDTDAGGHFHPYDELYYLAMGQAEFYLEDIDTKEGRTFEMIPGSRLLIPSNVAHKVPLITEDAFLIGCTAEPWISDKVSAHKYEFSR